MDKQADAGCRSVGRAWLLASLGLLAAAVVSCTAASPARPPASTSITSGSSPVVASEITSFSMTDFSTSLGFCESHFGKQSAFLSAVYTQASADWIVTSGSTDVFGAISPVACSADAETPAIEAHISVALAPAAALAMEPSQVSALVAASPGPDHDNYLGFPTPTRLTAGVFYVRSDHATQIDPQPGHALPQPIPAKNGLYEGSIAVVYHGQHAWWCIWYDTIPVTADQIIRAQTWMALSDRRITD